MTHRLIASLVLVALTGATLPAQQGQPAPQQPNPATQAPQATFRSGTGLLVMDTVVVRDRDGNPVRGLTARDFVVTENNQPQEVVYAVYQDIQTDPLPPITAATAIPLTPAAAAAPAVAAQIAVPAAGDQRYENKRLLAMYFDMTAMGPAEQVRAFTNAQKYIETQMKSSDMIAIMAFQGGAVRVRQDFTNDREKLRAAIAILMYGDDLNNDGIPDTPDGGTPFGQDDGEFNVFNTDRRLSALQTAATMLRLLPQQKALIYFSGGLSLTGTENQAQLTATTNAAKRANVTFNTVDARGLVATAPMGDASRQSPSGAALFSGQMALTMNNRLQQSQDTLYALARDTGGKALLDYNDLSVGIVQAADAITSYYVIGYYSTNTATDGKFRRIRVSLANDKTSQVTHRAGYYADKSFANFTGADKERQLEEALMLEDPITEVTVAMEVNFFKLNSAEYFIPVAVKIPGSELAIAQRRGAPRTEIDFIGIIKDEYGNTDQNIRDSLPLRLTDDTAAQLATRPIQYDTGFTLLPGKYMIKVLTRDALTGRIGTYQTNFAIPNLDRENVRLPISTVVLSSQRVALTDALYSVKQKIESQSTNPLVHDGQKLFPSITRVFNNSRDMYVYLQAYQRGATSTQPLAVFVSFHQGDTKVFETAPIPVVDGMFGRANAVPIRVSVPLQSIPPGRYECQVTVLDPTSNKVAFWRAPVVLVAAS
jgi:VWFA-related protein